ncbi:MAG TPA: undecaprenyl-diphosphate phosphatase [Candidatus Angelobacter sp.]|nr:undecaprenyl-diphosphate phosphatase [Candidatus Angelobacter sp.]
MNELYSILLGLVQGVSEWLPISSKTQVLFASTLFFSLPLAVAYAFGLFMEIGSVGSAVVYFRRDILSLFHDRRLVVYLLVVTVFTGLVGAPLYYLTDKILTTSPYNIGIPMVLLGLVLIGIGFYIRYSRAKPRLVDGLQEMKLKNYVVIGIAQGIAALPGVSRSGMTVSTMLLMGVKPDQAFRLSYLAYIPASLGAFFVTLILSRSQVDTAIQVVEPTGILIAIATAAVVGIAVISYLLKFAKTSRIYVIDFVLGAIALVVGVIATLLAPQSSSLGLS